MIETKTSWEDSGFDCEHCGGEILMRRDHETGLPDRLCYQCCECGCQWTLDGAVQRVGFGAFCKAAAREQARASGFGLGELTERASRLSNSLWILLAIIAGAALLRFGGAFVARYLLPLALLGACAFVLLRLGRKQHWW